MDEDEVVTSDKGVEADPLADFAAGFDEGTAPVASNDADPLDFDDKPAPVAEKEEAPEEAPKAEAPKKEEPVAKDVVPQDEAAKIYDMLDRRLPKEQPLVEDKKPTPKEEPKAEPEKPALTADETARLKELSSEWKDVSEMFALQAKQMSDAVSKEVARQVAEIKREFSATLQPIQQDVQMSAADRYDTAVKAQHPEVYDKTQSEAFGNELVDWVKSQPTYLREAYAQAFNSPDPQDAIDLITRFKKDTGKESSGTTSEQPVETPAVPAKTAPKDDSRDKKLRQMAQPMSRQTKGAEGDDPLDFEGGFKEMVRQMERTG